MFHIEWKEKYGPKTRPAYQDLLDFLPESVSPLFVRFNQAMENKYQVYNKYQRYEPGAGWVYGYCRNYRCELLSVRIGEGCFIVLGVQVRDEVLLNDALEKAKAAYDAGYEEKYARVSALKRSNQSERSKLRVEREKVEMAVLQADIDPAKLNRFCWPEKLSRSKLVALYLSDAAGLVDEALLDDVGYALYARCKLGQELRPLLEKGRMICHHCGKVIAATSYTTPAQCECGQLYTYREYRRSCNASNIPGGRATPIFDAFVEKWTACKDAKDKMLAIDWLIHECHVSVMSGVRGRSVCVNLIEGTAAQLRDMLEMLAGK